MKLILVAFPFHRECVLPLDVVLLEGLALLDVLEALLNGQSADGDADGRGLDAPDNVELMRIIKMCVLNVISFGNVLFCRGRVTYIARTYIDL